MTASGTRPSPRRDRAPVLAALAILLAVAGLVLSIWRPVAPDVGAVSTLLDRFPADTLATIDAYRRPRLVAAVAGLLVRLAVPLLVVATPTGRRLLDRVAGPPGAGGVRRGAVVAVAIAASTSLARFPLAVWIGYVHEGRWGFRNAGAGLWLRDWVVGEALVWLVAAVLGAALVGGIRRWPGSWHWRGAVAAFAATAVLTALYPLVIQPLFLPSRPLADPRVEALVVPLLDRAGLGDVPVRVGDASTRTTRVNAFVAGVGPTRRVVLYDNLLELPDEQLRFVLAHELAHREHADVARGVLASAAGLLVVVLVLRRALDDGRSLRLVGARSAGDPRMVAVAAVLLVTLQVVAMPVAMLASRRAEAAADARALELTGEPAGLVHLARTFVVRDLARPEHERWVRVLWGSHPSPADRIRRAVASAGAGTELPGPEQLRRAEDRVRHPALDAGGGP